VRRTPVKVLSQTRDPERRSQGGFDEDSSGVPTPRVPVLLSNRFGRDAYRDQLQRDLSDFAHPDFGDEITPVVDVRDLFGSEEEFSAVFPRGWGRAPVPELSDEPPSADEALAALPRGSHGVPEVDLDELRDAAESRRNSDLNALWTQSRTGETPELVVHGTLSRSGHSAEAAVTPRPRPGTGSMWATMRPPPLSSVDREAAVDRASTGSLKPTSRTTEAGWSASHGPVMPPVSVLPPSCADDGEPPAPLLLRRVRSSPPSPGVASGSSIAPVYYTDAPPPVDGDRGQGRGAGSGLFRSLPAWAPPLVSAVAASALTLVVLGWSSGRTVPEEPAASSDPTTVESLLSAAAAPSVRAAHPESTVSRPDFDRPAAEAALARAAAQAAGCAVSDAPRAIDVRVTFGPEGTVSRALILDGSLLGTPQGACVTSAFHRARIPRFPPPAVTLQRSVQLGSAD
jgi:hypothetical protein